jgi:hypothetical protein
MLEPNAEAIEPSCLGEKSIAWFHRDGGVE